jgi:copper chaperone CopZ
MATLKLRIELPGAAAEAPLAARLRALPGVLAAVVSHAAASAEVEFEDDCIDIDEIRRAIAACGYETRIVG